MAGSGVDFVSSRSALTSAGVSAEALGIAGEYEELPRHNWLPRTEERQTNVPVGFRKQVGLARCLRRRFGGGSGLGGGRPR